jgi:DNA-directed RNA polymerase subunit L
MEIKILKRTPDELQVEIIGEGHTFCNLLEKALLEDPTVEVGGYSLEHPLVANPIIHVRMKEKRKPEKRPETAVKEAAEKIRHRNKEFRTSFEKALEQWQKK